MRVEIIRQKVTHRGKWDGETVVEKIDFSGETIIPYYINVMSINHYPDKLVIRMLGDYKTKETSGYDEENEKPNHKLWIMGKDVEPGPETEVRIK